MESCKTPNGRDFDLVDGFISGEIEVHINEMVRSDLESFLDLISERLTGSTLLSETSYEAVGVQDGKILLKVEGDPSIILEMSADDEQSPPSP